MFAHTPLHRHVLLTGTDPRLGAVCAGTSAGLAGSSGLPVLPTNRHPKIPLGAATNSRNGRQGEASRSARGHRGRGTPRSHSAVSHQPWPRGTLCPHRLSPASRRAQHPRELLRAPHGRTEGRTKGRLAEHPGARSPRGPRAGPDRSCSPWAAGRWSGERRDAQDRGAEGQTGSGRSGRDRGEETKDSRAISARGAGSGAR